MQLWSGARGRVEIKGDGPQRSQHGAQAAAQRRKRTMWHASIGAADRNGWKGNEVNDTK